jgi:hypothetical protein
MNNRNGELLRLTLKELDAGAAVLGRAFAEYEFLQYYFPDETQRHIMANTFVLIALSVCLKYGEVYAASERWRASQPSCRLGRRLSGSGR